MISPKKDYNAGNLLKDLNTVCDDITTKVIPLMSHDFIKFSFNDPKVLSRTTPKIKYWINETMKMIYSQSVDFFDRAGIGMALLPNSSSDILLNEVNSKALVIIQLFLWACVSITCAQSISRLFCEEATAQQQKITSIQDTYLWLNYFVINVQSSVKHCTGFLSQVIQKSPNENLDPFTHACFTSHIVLTTSRVFSTFGIKPYKISIFNESNVVMILNAIGLIDKKILGHNMYGVMTAAFLSFLKTNPLSGNIVHFPDTFSKLGNLELNDTDYDRTFNIMWFLYHFKEVNDFVQWISLKETRKRPSEETPKSPSTPIIKNKKTKLKTDTSLCKNGNLPVNQRENTTVIRSLHNTQNQLNNEARSGFNKKTNLSEQPKGKSDSEILQLMIPTLMKLEIIKEFTHVNDQRETTLNTHVRKIFTKNYCIKNQALWAQLDAFSKCVRHLLRLAEEGTTPTKGEGILIRRTHSVLDLKVKGKFGKMYYDTLFANLASENGPLENEDFVRALVMTDCEVAILPLLEMYLKPKEGGQDKEKSNQSKSKSSKWKTTSRVVLVTDQKKKNSKSKGFGC